MLRHVGNSLLLIDSGEILSAWTHSRGEYLNGYPTKIITIHERIVAISTRIRNSLALAAKCIVFEWGKEFEVEEEAFLYDTDRRSGTQHAWNGVRTSSTTPTIVCSSQVVQRAHAGLNYLCARCSPNIHMLSTNVGSPPPVRRQPVPVRPAATPCTPWLAR